MFHDLRHTGGTRILETGVTFPVLAMIMGWSPATTVRMAKRYRHMGQKSLRNAVESISSATQRAPNPTVRNAEDPVGSFDIPLT
jgi:integrase